MEAGQHSGQILKQPSTDCCGLVAVPGKRAAVDCGKWQWYPLQGKIRV